MKNIVYIIFTIACCAVLFSCKKYEQLPLERNHRDDVFDPKDWNGTYALQFLNNIYADLPRPGAIRIGNGVLDAATDDATTSAFNSAAYGMITGRLSTIYNPDDSWAANYAGIRKTNIFLNNIDIVPFKDPLIPTKAKAEARFLRAMFYFELVKRYGGVPLLGDSVYSFTDNLNIARNSFDQCVKYIADECDSIKNTLPAMPVDGEAGRATKGAALALKSRLLLYTASPLNNPAGNQNYTAKWQSAADAAKAVIDLGATYALATNFIDVFTKRKYSENKEVIFAYQRGQTFDLETALSPVGYSLPNASNGYISPSQNLVDAYPMNNGRAITDPASGFVVATPYRNRDPRLTLTVFLNGTKWLKRDVETFEGGKDKPGGAITQTRTAYYQKKLLADMSNVDNYTNIDHSYTIFRYAEILLNYAEAINEVADLDANRTIALTQLKAIRLRAGIPKGITAGFEHGLKLNMTQAGMKEAIRLERRLEMAFEEQRFWDLRRWEIAEQVLNNKPLYGITITKDANTGKLSYSAPFPVLTMVFTPNMYRYPIPYSEIAKNPNLTQNSGW